MVDIRLRITEQQLEELQRLADRAQAAYGTEISIQAVLLSAASRGVPDVVYEIEAKEGRAQRGLRLVR